MKQKLVIGLMVLFVFFLLQGDLLAQDGPMPWESPDSGFQTGTSGSGGGTDKIEKVVNTSGGSKDSGTTTSKAGTDKQQGFVNDFLDKTGEKIKNAGGGSGWVWTWQKKWKVGPDGKPAEVKEEWQKGNIGVTTKPTDTTPAGPGPGAPGPGAPASPKTTAGAPKPTAGGTPAAGSGSPAPGSPSKAGPKATAKAPGAAPAAPGSPAAPGGKPTTTAAKPVATPVPPGVDPAPPKLPPAQVRLVIQNPITFEEEPFSTNVYPQTPNPPLSAVRSKLKKAVPEDTRVRIGLELSKDVDPKDVTLTITDNEGQQPPVAQQSFQNYRHMFRIPDDNRYYARVLYKHPKSTDPTPKEVIKVIIPVYKMGFDSRTIDADQSRTGKAIDRQGGPSGNALASTYSRGDGSTNTGEYADGSQADFSDMYTDPNNPPEVSGADGDGSFGGAGDGTQAGQNDGDSTKYTGTRPDGSSDHRSGKGQQYADGSGQGRDIAKWSSDQGDYRSGNSQTQMAAATPGSRGYSGGGGAGSSGGSSSSGSSHRLGSGGSGSGSSDSQAGSGGSAGYDGTSQDSGSSSGAGDASDGGAGDSSGAGAMSADSGANGDSGSTTGGTENPAADNALDRAYLIGLSMRNEVSKQAQSFNFTEDPFPTSGQVKKNSQISFSIAASSNVLRETVNIVVYDGKQKVELPLNNGGEAFAHVFKQPTGEAYVWIYGNTKDKQFSYKLSIPVSE